MSKLFLMMFENYLNARIQMKTQTEYIKVLNDYVTKYGIVLLLFHILQDLCIYGFQEYFLNNLQD